MHLKLLAVALMTLFGSLGLAQDAAKPEYNLANTDSDIEVKDAVVDKFGEDVALVCSPKKVDEDKDLPSEIKWKRDGVDIVDTEEKYKIGSNGNLTIISVMPEDVGEYECIVELGNGNSFNKTVNLYSAAYVYAFDKSKNLVQGDPLVLECKVDGHPTPGVTWLKDDKALDTSDERVKLKANGDGVENGTLRIENLDFEDRADYVCLAENSYGFHNSTILVRVKDKLAALWPFLGICAEVAILVVIIFIYERKRAKKLEEMEAKEEADHLTNSHSHKGGDDVRQRK